MYRVRQAFVERGLKAALFRRKPTGRQYHKLDGAQEAQLIALACGATPRGAGQLDPTPVGGSFGGAGSGGHHQPGMGAHDP